MKKVLLPTDFSENAFNGICYAIQLLENAPCEFYLLHAYTAKDSVGVLISVLDILQDDAFDVLEVEAEKIRKKFPARNLEIKCIAQVGTLAQAIKEVITLQEIDLVVMGTQGEDEIADILWGTNTATVLRGIKCPLLVIPYDYPFHKPEEILITIDQAVENRMNGQFQPLVDLIDSYDPTYTFLNIKSPEHVHEKVEVAPPWLKKYHHANKIVEYHEDVEKGILNYVSRWPTDMLVMIAHAYQFPSKLFHKSISKKIVMETSVPVLVLHD